MLHLLIFPIKGSKAENWEPTSSPFIRKYYCPVRQPCQLKNWTLSLCPSAGVLVYRVMQSVLLYKLHLSGWFCASLRAQKTRRNVFPVCDALSPSKTSSIVRWWLFINLCHTYCPTLSVPPSSAHPQCRFSNVSWEYGIDMSDCLGVQPIVCKRSKHV